MKLFKNLFNSLDNEGKMMLNTIIEALTLVGLFTVSLLLIAYFIILWKSKLFTR